MMALAMILLLGLLVWLATIFGARVAATARVPIAAAIMFGLTGYLLAGQPGLAGAPKQPPAATDSAGFGEELTDPRGGMGDRFNEANQWLGASDGLMRLGRTESAARMLESGLRRFPRNVDLWVGYGNAMVAHAGGVMTPAAAMAFDKAADIDPTHPGPPFFAGLSLAQGGDFAGARMIWQQLLDRSPADAPWRADLMQRLSSLPPAAAPAPAAEAATPATAPGAAAPAPAP